MKLSATLVLVLFLLSIPALAATRTWTGNSSANWTDSNNWGGTAPVAGDDLVFPSGALNLSNNNDFTAGTSFNSITFSGNGYTLAGNAIALVAGVTTSNATGTNTISLNITFSGPMTWTNGVGATLLVMNGATNIGANNLVLNGNGDFNFNGVISGSGGVSSHSNGTATLSGANSYSGLTDIVNGYLVANNPVALGASGTGTMVEVGGTLVIGAGITISSEPLTLNGLGFVNNGALESQFAGAAQWSGPITLGTNPVRFQALGSSTLILAGQITGGAGFQAGGAGVIVLLNSTNNFSGAFAFGNSDLATVRLGADNAIPSTADVTIPAGNTLDLNGHVDTIQGLIGDPAGTVLLGSGVLTLTTSTFPIFNGTISGSGGVTFSGTGTQSLEGLGAINYTGQTDVIDGILTLGAQSTVGNVTVSVPGVLGMASGATAGNISVINGGFEPGLGGAGNAGCQALNVASGTYFELINDATPGDFGSMTVSGSVTLGGVLDLVGTMSPTPAHSFTMINNTGVNAVSGTFSGIPEGSVIAAGSRSFHITYQGGDGNDVVLTELAARGDFNGDMLGDLFWRNVSTGSNSMWMMNGTTVGSSAAEPLVDPSFRIAGIGDFQGDGKADILWRNTSTGANVVWLMNGSTVAASALLPTVADPTWTVAGVGDLQGDGKDDIVWRNTVTGDNAVWFMNGLSVGVAASLPSVPDTNWHIVAVADLQGDGKADLVWRNSAIGADSVWLMNGPAVAVSAALPSVPDTNWQIVGAGDFQHDGKADLLWRNASTGDNVLWFMNGTSVAAAAPLPSVPDVNWQIVKIGDFQGDGKADIFWRHAVTGSNSVWLMNGPNVALGATLPTVSDPNWKVAGPP